MKNLFLIALTSAVCYLTYYISESRLTELDLKQQVKMLETKNDELLKKLSTIAGQLKAKEAALTNDHSELASKLDVERKKLLTLIDQKKALEAGLNEPSRVNSVKDLNQQIKDQNALHASINRQMITEQGSEKYIDRDVNQAKQFQKMSKDQTLGKLDERIRLQTEAIQTAQASMNEEKRSRDLYRNQRVEEMRPGLDRLKADLEDLKRQKNAVFFGAQIDNSKLQNQMTVDKEKIKKSEQELRAQAGLLQGEIKSLERLRDKASEPIGGMKQQISSLDQQIKAQQNVVSDLEALVKTQNK